MRKNICLLLFLLPFLCIGCDKEMQEDESIEGASVPLNILIGNYEDFDDISSPKTRSAETVQTFVQPLDSTKDTGINVVTTIELVPTERSIQTRASMNNNSRFRMVIYNSAGNQVADNQYTVSGNTATLVSGTAPILVPGTYKFVSYTKNIATLSELGNVVTVSNGDDFATSCVSKTISSTDNSITVMFKRQMSLFQLAVSASGFSNNTATYGSAVVGNICSQGTWNVNSNSSDDTGLALSGTGSITCYDNNQYKVFPVSRTLSISFTNLNIGGTNYGAKSVSVPATFVKKGNYKVTVQFTKAGDYIDIGGIKWAKGNLIFRDGIYQFFPSQELKTLAGGPSFWNQNNYDFWDFYRLSMTPNATDIGDPCTRVAPVGTWRTPTITDCLQTINKGYVKGTYNGITGFYFGTNTIPAENVRDNYLFLPVVGYRRFDSSNSYGDVRAYRLYPYMEYWCTGPVTQGEPKRYALLTELLDNTKLEVYPYVNSPAQDYGATIRCVK